MMLMLMEMMYSIYLIQIGQEAIAGFSNGLAANFGRNDMNMGGCLGFRDPLPSDSDIFRPVTKSAASVFTFEGLVKRQKKR